MDQEIEMTIDGELLVEFPEDDHHCLEKKHCVKEITLGNETKKWKRFVILPAKIGQKYVFGSIFSIFEENKDEEDQFICIEKQLLYSPLIVATSAVQYDPMVEITVCEQRKFWITPLKENTIVLNDIKIEGKTALSFGDRIFIGDLKIIKQRSTYYMNQKEKPYFLFQPRQTNPGAFLLSDVEKLELEKQRDKQDKKLQELMVNFETKTDPNLLSTLNQNALIVSNILSHLSVDDLKNVRLVSKRWSAEGVKQLKKKACVHFNFNFNIFENDPLIWTRMFIYDYDINNGWINQFGLSNAILSFPDDDDFSKKVFTDLDWFYARNHGFKKLKLNMPLVAKQEFDILVKILAVVSPTLEELELSTKTEYGMEDDPLYKFPFEDSTFDKLKKFMISTGGLRVDDCNIFVRLVSAMKMKNINEIVLNSESKVMLNFLESTNTYGDGGTEISLIVRMEISDSYCPCPMELLEFLLSSQFKKSLKKFDIGYDGLYEENILDEENIPIFQQVLEKHCKTLECLKFGMPCLPDKWSLEIPVFPKLKVLEISFHSCYEELNKDMGMKTSIIFLDQYENGMDLDYNRHFPNLQSLSILPTQLLSWDSNDGFKPYYKWDSDKIRKIWIECYDFFKIFFPFLPPTTSEQLDAVDIDEKLMFKNLVHLRIPYEQDRPERLEMIAAMFPNVRNKWINKIRKNRTTPSI